MKNLRDVIKIVWDEHLSLSDWDMIILFVSLQDSVRPESFFRTIPDTTVITEIYNKLSLIPKVWLDETVFK